MSTTLAPPARSESTCNLRVADVSSRLEQQTLAARLSAYAELAKSRIAMMVLLSMGVGYVLASQGNWELLPLLHASVGIVLAVVASSAFNQVIERRTDALMPRTAGRPLPSQRLGTAEVFWFASVCSVVSTLYLAVTVNSLTAGLTLLTTFLYAAVYTPLKRHTSFCTAIGAIPGAAPPVLGWVAAGGALNMEAFALFAILFLWQFPHFLAIAWLYREQYLGAGLKMIPALGKLPVVGGISLGYALVLVPVSFLPAQLGLAGDLYRFFALGFGLMYAAAAWQFYLRESRQTARRLLFASLIYLPGILFVLMFDHFRLLS